VARGTKISRAVLRALYGIPIRPVHGSDRSTYGLCIELILRPFISYGLFCAVIAPAHALSPTPARTRAGSAMLNPRRITLVWAVALLFGMAALVALLWHYCSARARCGDGYGPLRRERNLSVLVYVNTHARPHTHTRARIHTHNHGHTRTHKVTAHTRTHSLTHT
jgi:hypothetical protein